MPLWFPIDWANPVIMEELPTLTVSAGLICVLMRAPSRHLLKTYVISRICRIPHINIKLALRLLLLVFFTTTTTTKITTTTATSKPKPKRLLKVALLRPLALQGPRRKPWRWNSVQGTCSSCPSTGATATRATFSLTPTFSLTLQRVFLYIQRLARTSNSKKHICSSKTHTSHIEKSTCS